MITHTILTQHIYLHTNHIIITSSDGISVSIGSGAGSNIGIEDMIGPIDGSTYTHIINETFYEHNSRLNSQNN